MAPHELQLWLAMGAAGFYCAWGKDILIAMFDSRDAMRRYRNQFNANRRWLWISALEQASAGDLLGGGLHIAKRREQAENASPSDKPIAGVDHETRDYPGELRGRSAISPEALDLIAELAPAFMLEFRARKFVFGPAPTCNREAVGAAEIERWFLARGVAVEISGCVGGRLTFARARLTGTHRLLPPAACYECREVFGHLPTCSEREP